MVNLLSVSFSASAEGGKALLTCTVMREYEWENLPFRVEQKKKLQKHCEEQHPVREEQTPATGFANNRDRSTSISI